MAGWRSRLKTAVWGAAAAALVALPMWVIDHKLWDATTASWAQAVGSILAVFAAFMVAAYQQFRAAAEKKARKEALLKGAEVVASAIGAAIATPYRFATDSTLTADALSRAPDFSSFERARILFDRFPIFEIDDPEVVMALASLSLSLGSVANRTDRTLEKLRKGDISTEELARLEQQATQARDLCGKVYQAAYPNGQP